MVQTLWRGGHGRRRPKRPQEAVLNAPRGSSRGPAATCRRLKAPGSARRDRQPARRKRARWRHQSWRRQPDHEARACHHGLAVGVGWTQAIFGPDPPAMRFDDLLGDRKPESGVLAKALMRPVGVEALEDAFQ